MKKSRAIKRIGRLTLALLVVGQAIACASPSEPVEEPVIDLTTEPTAASVDEPTSEPAAGLGEIKSERQRLTAEVSGAETAELVGGNNAFALELYQALRSTDGNLFYSPYSISLALAMTYAGARGETERQMSDTLHYTLPPEQLHSAFNALDAMLTGYGGGDESFQLNVANAIWGQVGYEFLSSYLDTLAENYGAGLRSLDFSDEPVARETINRWVSEQTEEKIKNLIPRNVLSSAVRLVLTNAIYFNGKWLSQFEESATQDERFTLLDDSSVMVPMMSQTETFGYVEGDGYQAIALPYQGAPVSMLFVLPDSGRFEEVEAAWSADSVDGILENLARRTVILSVPKFSFEAQFGLAQTLADMGMGAAFGAGADFSGMTGSPDLFISDVLHKAFVAVDEAGTEAAAATAVIMLESEMIVENPVTLKLDRPFLFLIRDDETGTILFAGRLLNPTL